MLDLYHASRDALIAQVTAHRGDFAFPAYKRRQRSRTG